MFDFCCMFAAAYVAIADVLLIMTFARFYFQIVQLNWYAVHVWNVHRQLPDKEGPNIGETMVSNVIGHVATIDSYS